MLSLRIFHARLTVFTLSLLFLAFLVETAELSASPTTTVKAGSISLYPNEIGNVPITVTDIPANGGLGAYDIKVTFDPSVIQVLDVTGGSSPFNSVAAKNINNEAGEVCFNHFITATQGPTGTITIAYLKVKAVGKAGSSTSLKVTVYSLVDAKTGNEITPRSSVSGSVTIKIPKSPSTISISISKTTLRIGENLTVFGTISPARSATVTITFTRPDSTKVTKTTSSSSDGAYSYTFTPDMAGTWSVKASWPGDSKTLGATSLSKTFTVTKLNSTITISISQMVIEPEGTVKIEGVVHPSVSGATVTIEYRFLGGAWNKIADVTTKGNGEYSYEWMTGLTEPGTYEVRASWQGNDMYEGAQSNIKSFNVAESSVLSISLSCNSTAVNNPVVIRGCVSPAHEYVNVTLMIISPNGTVTYKNISTDIAGNYKMVFTPDVSGPWIFKASWQGDLDTLGCESLETKLTVVTVGTTISLKTSAPSTRIGTSMLFLGKITPSPGVTTVTLILTRPNSSLVTLQTETEDDGSFSFAYTPDQAGIWLAQASWPGSKNLAGATSLQASFTVEKLSSSISLSCNPPIPKKGDLITFEGYLTPNFQDERIRISLSEDEGRTWNTISLCKTDVEGKFSTSWRADKIGTFIFRSEWTGNAEYSGCSILLTLTIQEDTVAQKVVLPNNEIVEVISSTNSSSISFKVDVEKGVVEANVTGPEGTTGTMNIFIPNSLLEYYGKAITDIVFTVDKIPIKPEIVELFNGYLATLRYSHSERIIHVYYVTYSLSVTVLNYDNLTLANAYVVLDGPVKTSNFTDNSGTAYFSSLPKGEYAVMIYYGPLVGEDSLSMNEDKAVTIRTTVGKLEAEYAELSTNYENLKIHLNTLTNVMYILAATTVTFIVTTLYFAKRRRSD